MESKLCKMKHCMPMVKVEIETWSPDRLQQDSMLHVFMLCRKMVRTETKGSVLYERTTLENNKHKEQCWYIVGKTPDNVILRL